MKEEEVKICTAKVDGNDLHIHLIWNDFKNNSFSSVYLRGSNRDCSLSVDTESADRYGITNLSEEAKTLAKIGDLSTYGSTCYLDNITYYMSPTDIQVVPEKRKVVLVHNDGSKVPFINPFNTSIVSLLLAIDGTDVDLKDYKTIVKVPKKLKVGEYAYSDNYTLAGISEHQGKPINDDPWYEALFYSMDEATMFVNTISDGIYSFKVVTVPKHEIDTPNTSYSPDTAVDTLKSYSGKLYTSKLSDNTYLMEVCKDIMYNTTLPLIRKYFSEEAYNISKLKADKIYN